MGQFLGILLMNDDLNEMVVNKCLLTLFQDVGRLVLVELVFGKKLVHKGWM